MPNVKTFTEIEIVPLTSLKPYWRNPRDNAAAVPGVKESIKAFGVMQPLVVDKKGVIIVGHTRYRAMLELDLKEVPVIRAKHLSEKDAKAYRIADNKTNERAEWNRDALVPELRESDLSLMGLFFDEADLAKLLSDTDNVTFKPVTAEAMDKVLNRQQSNGPGARASSGDSGQVKLECPHCAEQFWIDRSVIETGHGER